MCNKIDSTECPSSSGAVFFRSTSNNPVGEFPDAVVRGNDFVGQTSWSQLIHDVNFPGTSFFACNKPSWANDTSCVCPECNEADLALLHSVSNVEELPFDDLMRLATNCPSELSKAAWQFTGDLNDNGYVNYVDLAMFNEQWLITKSGECGPWFNFEEFAILADSWLKGPEP